MTTKIPKITSKQKKKGLQQGFGLRLPSELVIILYWINVCGIFLEIYLTFRAPLMIVSFGNSEVCTQGLLDAMHVLHARFNQKRIKKSNVFLCTLLLF